MTVLEEMGYVGEEKPVIGKGRTIYKINDKFFNFWFRFVYSRKSEIEMRFDIIEDIKSSFNEYVGLVFEDIVKQFLIRLNRVNRLPFRFTKIGRWWHKNEEIDLVALNEREKRALFIEVKWKELNEGKAERILKDLERKAELVNLEDWDKNYGVVAKHVKGKEKMREKGWPVWDLQDLKNIQR